MSVRTRMRRALALRSVWVGFVLIMLAFGTLDTLSSWMVSYMVEKRGSPEAASRYQLAGLWGGIASGRVVLALVLGKRLGERTFAIAMLTGKIARLLPHLIVTWLILALRAVAAMLLLVVVWLVKSFILDACALVLVGFFMGPVTPKVLSVVSARVPPSLKSSVMSLTIGIGLIGSALGPLLFGILAGTRLEALPGVLVSVYTLQASSP